VGLVPRAGTVPTTNDVNGQPLSQPRRGVGVVWFRRDLRLADNPALCEALRAHEAIVPLFVWDPRLADNSGAVRRNFLFGCLEALNESLDGQLVIRSGDPTTVVAQVTADAGAEVVWCAEDFGPYGAQRDAAVARDLEGRGARLVRVGSPYAVAPGLLLSGSHRPYQVFTPFSKAWLAHGWSQPLNRPRRGDLRIAQLPSEKLVTPPEVAAVLPLAGEDAAQQRLVQFLLHLVDNYDEQRDRPDLDGTSRLSPYLKFGCLHPRQVLHSLDPTNRAHHRYVTELCWREFYADVLFHRPDSAHEPFRDQWRDFEVDSGATADARFDRWCHGQTGYPIVDAGMRQLLAEGWMHNRVRMIVASFLVKDLHVDWRRGAKWFMQHLVDGDLASNQHGWQWVAGTGTDASPYFRIFNPLTQAKRFDPHGDYVRRWVPELATMPELTIHEPSRARPATLVADAGYPSPIVDHARERTDALLRYQKLRTA
jgi:deoxyribodipyrimidine photo-lyase